MDRGSLSRNDREGRSNPSGGSKGPYTKCIGCLYESCIQMRKKMKNGEVSVNLCEEYTMNEEFLVNYAEKGKQIMILDIGAQVSLVRIEWMTQYLKEYDLELGDLKTSDCHQVFRFGPSRQYVSTKMVKLPIMVQRWMGKMMY